MKNQSCDVLILSFTLAVVMLGYGIVMPIIPFYVKNLGASGREMGMLTAISALMQFLFAPLWGGLSGRYGRRPVLLLGVCGYGITLLIFGLSTELWMLFVARALNGMLSSATLPASMAYIADSTPAAKRGAAMGRLGAAVGAGMVLGPGLGGVLAVHSLSTPFFLASALCLVAWLLVYFFLPETHPQSERKQDGENLFMAISLQPHKILLSEIGIFLLLAFVVSFGMTGFQGVLGLYALDRFNMQTGQVGSLWVAIGAMLIVGQGALTGMSIRHLGEKRTVRLSLLAAAVAFATLPLAGNYLFLLLGTACLVLSISLLGPVLNALISYHARFEQGLTMGLSNAATSLGKILGPLWTGFLYDVDVHYPFFSGAGILSLALLISLAWFPSSSTQDEGRETMAEASGKSAGGTDDLI